jgi:dienelactone hydrolase
MRAILILLVVAGPAAVVGGAEELAFRVHCINPESQFSAGAAIDINQDGRLDIACGGWWYEAPDWKRHRLRDVPNIRGRFDDYSNLPLDVDSDGHVDLISVNYRSRSLYWIRNPGPQGRTWATHLIDSPGPSETGRLVDVDGDGELDILPAGTDFASWYQRSPSEAPDEQPQWIRHLLPAELAGHGVGAGDINGDGRIDIVGPRGWAEGAPSRRWVWHAEFQLHGDASIPILVGDVDRDGDADLVWGRGHDTGLYWMEQIRDKSQPQEDRLWRQHAIDTSWSSAHSLLWADLDGDGQPELVAGKRFLGHDGRDPGENDPLAIYAYQFNVERGTWKRNCLSWGGICGMDLDPKAVDLDADGDVDLIAPARSGLCWLENLRITDDADVPSAPCPPSSPSGYDPRQLLIMRTVQGESERVTTPLDWGLRRAHIVERMQEVMGPLPGPRQRVALDVQVESVEQTPTYWRKKLTYQAEPGDRVPAYLLIPKSLQRPAPAMLCLHPTSPLGKAQICALGGEPSRFYAHELAERGYVVLAPDYPSFGDYTFDFQHDGSDYASGSMKAIWNNIRALDLLETLPEVDGQRIGCIGHSLGGHNSLFTAVMDQRIRAVVTSCGFTAFGRYYGGNLTGWTSDRYMPRIRHVYGGDPQAVPFDFHEVLAAIAPRPLFVSAPVRDDNFDHQGVTECVDAARQVWRMLGAPDQLVARYPDAAHDFPDPVRREVYAWLDGVLKD